MNHLLESLLGEMAVQSMLVIDEKHVRRENSELLAGVLILGHINEAERDALQRGKAPNACYDLGIVRTLVSEIEELQASRTISTPLPIAGAALFNVSLRRFKTTRESQMQMVG